MGQFTIRGCSAECYCVLAINPIVIHAIGCREYLILLFSVCLLPAEYVRQRASPLLRTNIIVPRDRIWRLRKLCFNGCIKNRPVFVVEVRWGVFFLAERQKLLKFVRRLRDLNLRTAQ
jgi:hypothetical protein